METKTAITALAALAQETRLTAFRLLVQAGPAGLAAGEIASRLAVPPATLSFHLKELTKAGLLVSRQEGRHVIYAVDFPCIHHLLAYLSENCCGGRPELCAPGMVAAGPLPDVSCCPPEPP